METAALERDKHGIARVVNVAAKLFAAYPGLSAVEVKKLIAGGADEKAISGGRSIRLLRGALFRVGARGPTLNVNPAVLDEIAGSSQVREARRW